MRILPLLAGLLVLAAPPAAGAQQVGQGLNATAAPAPASLNHLYVVVDAETFAAIRDSGELARLLGRTDGGLPDYAPPAPDADRVFFRGRETYLEIFAPENRFGEPVGKVGLALGHDDPAAFEALESAWREVCPAGVRRTPVAYQGIAPPVPWYDAVQCDETAGGDHLAVWAMVYLPQFHAWQTRSMDEGARTARADILAPRAADGQGRFDITGVSLWVESETFERLTIQLTRAGLARHDATDSVVFTGQGWALELRASNRPRLEAIELSTDTALAERLSLGSGAVVALAEARVRWLP
jgi:hypothetical protein